MAGIKLDSAGIQAVLNSGPVASGVRGLAESIASGVRSQLPGVDVVVDSYTAVPRGRFTARPAASVTIRDARGRLWQARDGVLTRAAAASGAEVKAR